MYMQVCAYAHLCVVGVGESTSTYRILALGRYQGMVGNCANHQIAGH
jgi:hypothetical protein